MIRRCLLLAAALFAAGCSGSTADPDPGAAPPGSDVREAAARFLIERAMQGKAKPEVVHLALSELEDAGRFCARLRDLPVPVRPLPVGGAPAERGAYIIRLGDVSSGPNEARVAVLDYPAAEPPDCGTPYPLRLRREGGRWVVID